MLPESSQARKAIWGALNPHTGKRRIDEAFPSEIRKGVREDEMIITFQNGSTWQLVGSDNFMSLVGTSVAGMVFSEFAKAHPSCWAYLSPILEENNGWAVFASTPQGNNHFKGLYDLAKTEPGWFCEKLTNDETHVFKKGQLEAKLRELKKLYGDAYGESLWLQEYFCSFDAAMPGSIFGEWLDRLRKQNRIGDFPFDPSLPVNTAWDLGRTDATAIWFYQITTDITVFDYHESNLKDVPFYADLLRQKAKEQGFTYGTHWLPHDARARTLAAGGKSIQQQMIDHNVGRIVIAKRLDHVDGIQAARATLPYCKFDSKNCDEGLEALKNYRYEWDEEKRTFNNNPVHDWASHGASAFRTLSLSWKRPKAPKGEEAPLIERLQKSNIHNMTFGALKEKHFRNMKLRREVG